MGKTDLTRLYPTAYKASKVPELVRLPPANYLSISGTGDPDGQPFAHAIQALYSVAYTIKFSSKQSGKDFIVPRLEALWSFDTVQFGNPSLDMAPQQIPRESWNYRLLLRMPEFVRPETLTGAIDKVSGKKQLLRAADVTWFNLHEGDCVQLLHTGPFSTEPESLKQIAAFMKEHGLEHNGQHHEVYLSDFRKTPAERLKTILREPVKRQHPEESSEL